MDRVRSEEKESIARTPTGPPYYSPLASLSDWLERRGQAGSQSHFVVRFVETVLLKQNDELGILFSDSLFSFKYLTIIEKVCRS